MHPWCALKKVYLWFPHPSPFAILVAFGYFAVGTAFGIHFLIKPTQFELLAADN